MEPTTETTTTLKAAPAGETPERNGLGTYLSLAILVLSALATLTATIVGDGSAATDSAVIAAVFAAIVAVGKYAQAVAKILVQFRPVVSALEPLRQAARLSPAPVRDMTQSALASYAGSLADVASERMPEDESRQQDLVALDGDVPGAGGGDDPGVNDAAHAGPWLDEVPGGAGAQPIDDGTEEVSR